MMMWNYTVKYEKVLKRILSEIKMADYKYHMNPILILKYVSTRTKICRGKVWNDTFSMLIMVL